MANLVEGEALTAYSFEFSIDGQTIPNVIEVNNIQQETATIELKSMTPSGHAPVGVRASSARVNCGTKRGVAKITFNVLIISCRVKIYICDNFLQTSDGSWHQEWSDACLGHGAGVHPAAGDDTIVKVGRPCRHPPQAVGTRLRAAGQRLSIHR